MYIILYIIMNRKLLEAKKVAKKKKIENWETLKTSDIKDKRFSIISPSGKLIHFGLYPFKGEGTYLDHRDDTIRDAWRARHSKIKVGTQLAYKDKESPEYYSWNILW
jgi:hypothetical protein